MTIRNLLRTAGNSAGVTRELIQQADAARAEDRERDAATLYAAALRFSPERGDIHVQAGHMFKEAGDFAQAEFHYGEAARLMPTDADLAIQLAHFYKTAARTDEAIKAYRRAIALKPGWAEPRLEIENLAKTGWRSPDYPTDLVFAAEDPFEADLDREPFDPELAGTFGKLAPEQVPRSFRSMINRSEPSINITQFGVRMNTFWGMLRVARGVEPVRGFCISTEPLTKVTTLVNGVPVDHASMKGPYELEYEPDKKRIHKYVFHNWIDFSRFAPGRYMLELRFTDVHLRKRSSHEEFVVEPPLLEEDHPRSDAIVNLRPGAEGSIDEQIAARPSAIHEAERRDMLPEIKSILVSRADQLGDLVASIPGILRLRELFPHAKLVALCSFANADLARSLNVFEEVIPISLPESMYQRSRTMPIEDQKALRARLEPYKFDIAIDLAQSVMARAIIALSGAPFLYGFKDPAWPRLSACVDDYYYDPKNHREIATHSTRILTMIDRLAALHKSAARVIRRDDLERSRLEAFGIGEGERYAVLHTGARIIFSRWHGYNELALRLHRDTELKIVIFGDERGLRGKLPDELAQSDRIICIEEKLPFDDFDALLSFGEVYVGNDSGPKHLASLRGVPVVSIHSARINWSEWGQEHTGVIITRKLPCAGCLVYHDVDECGKDFVCVTQIKVDEVYDAVRRYV